MWEAIVVLAIVTLFATQPLRRKLPSGVTSSLMVVAGVALLLLVLLAPGAETWHRFGLLAVAALLIVRAGWSFWSARRPTETA